MYEFIKLMITGTPKEPDNEFEYKMKHPFDYRLNESKSLIQNDKYKIPIILEKIDNTLIYNNSDKSFTHDNELSCANDNYKFTVLRDITVKQLIILLTCDTSQFFHKNKTYMYVYNNGVYVPKLNETMHQLYCKYKQKDGFLYCKILIM